MKTGLFFAAFPYTFDYTITISSVLQSGQMFSQQFGSIMVVGIYRKQRCPLAAVAEAEGRSSKQIHCLFLHKNTPTILYQNLKRKLIHWLNFVTMYYCTAVNSLTRLQLHCGQNVQRSCRVRLGCASDNEPATEPHFSSKASSKNSSSFTLSITTPKSKLRKH